MRELLTQLLDTKQSMLRQFDIGTVYGYMIRYGYMEYNSNYGFGP